MTYAEYKDYLLRYLQRDGDTVLLADLDVSIANAEARLSRELRTDEFHLTTTFSLTALSASLPADWRSATLVFDDTSMTYLPTSMDNLLFIRRQGYTEPQPYYAISGRTINFALHNPGVSNPHVVTANYTPRAGSYKLTDTSNMRDLFPDLFDHAVLAELPLYMRDDERYGSFESAYMTRLNSVNDEVIVKEFGGAPLGSMLPEGIA